MLSPAAENEMAGRELDSPVPGVTAAEACTPRLPASATQFRTLSIARFFITYLHGADVTRAHSGLSSDLNSGGACLKSPKGNKLSRRA
jgi:hypothetical protein